jgi:mannitol/fructose-specific phosphotransferase system IIA component (Ntr-type)
MRIGEIIEQDHIVIIDKKYKKNELIKILLRKLCDLDNLDNFNEIYVQLLEREKLGSTAIGNGVALPHVRISVINKPHILICVVTKGIDFEASDKRAVRIIFLLLTPDKDITLHLNLLAHISHIVKDTEFVKRVSSSSDNLAIYNILLEEESKL